jgi:hypothetical protein
MPRQGCGSGKGIAKGFWLTFHWDSALKVRGALNPNHGWNEKKNRQSRFSISFTPKNEFFSFNIFNTNPW